MQELLESTVKPGKRRQIDWDAIEKEYIAGSLSHAEIARRHGLTPAAITMRAKRQGWSKDLSAQVRKLVKRKLVNDVVNSNNEEVTDREITEAAAQRGAEIIRSHRKDIRALRDAEVKLIAEIDNNPTKIWVGQYQGEVITKEIGIHAAERAAALQALGSVTHKRIALERQAYNLGDEGASLDEVLGALPEDFRVMVMAAFQRGGKQD